MPRFRLSPVAGDEAIVPADDAEGDTRLIRQAQGESEMENPAVQAPDGYRGDMDCLNPAPGYAWGSVVPPPTSGHFAREVIDTRTGEIVGTIEDWNGNNGYGKRAASCFYPR